MSNPSASSCQPLTRSNLTISFSFCTGIENSNPIIKGPDGRPVRMPCARILTYLSENGTSSAKLGYFMKRTIWPPCIMGTDYYETSESVVFPDGSTRGSNVLGCYGLTRQYHDRYRLPIMHIETNQFQELNAAFWLERQWGNVLRLHREGYPVIGFTCRRPSACRPGIFGGSSSRSDHDHRTHLRGAGRHGRDGAGA